MPKNLIIFFLCLIQNLPINSFGVRLQSYIGKVGAVLVGLETIVADSAETLTAGIANWSANLSPLLKLVNMPPVPGIKIFWQVI